MTLKGFSTEVFRPSGTMPTWDWNRCVHDPAGAVSGLKQRGDLIGLNLGAATDPSHSYNHWQGIVRLPVDSKRLFVLDKRVFLLNWAMIDIGVMGLARDDDGRRIGGNRMSTTSEDWFVAPPEAEAFLEEQIVSTEHGHAGGMQSLGSFLFVPLEAGPSDGQISIWDASKLTEDCSSCEVDEFLRFVTLTDHAAVAGVAKLADGASSDGGYVLATARDKSEVVEFYVVEPNGTIEDFSRDRFGILRGRKDVSGWRQYEHVSLLTGCNEEIVSESVEGPLFLLGTANTDGEHGEGDDFVDLYELTITDEADPNESGSSFTVTANLVASRHLFCSSSEYARQCNLVAAAGSYIDPDGRLILYGAEHDNDGPSGSVKMMEFRNMDHLDNPDTLSTVEGCSSVLDAFVELYDDFLDGTAGTTTALPGEQRSYLAECRDLQRRSFNLDRAHSFEDITRSVRYCIPYGYAYRLFEHSDMTGATATLRGDSSLSGIGDPSNGAIKGFNWSTTQGWSVGCFVHDNDPNTCIEQCD